VLCKENALQEEFWLTAVALVLPTNEDEEETATSKLGLLPTKLVSDCDHTTAGAVIKKAEMTTVRENDFGKTNTPDLLDFS